MMTLLQEKHLIAGSVLQQPWTSNQASRVQQPNTANAQLMCAWCSAKSRLASKASICTEALRGLLYSPPQQHGSLAVRALQETVLHRATLHHPQVTNQRRRTSTSARKLPLRRQNFLPRNLLAWKQLMQHRSFLPAANHCRVDKRLYVLAASHAQIMCRQILQGLSNLQTLSPNGTVTCMAPTALLSNTCYCRYCMAQGLQYMAVHVANH
jgi:hypothetical protein